MDQSSNRKRWIIGGTVLAAIYFSPTLIRSAQQIASGLPFVSHSTTSNRMPAPTAALPPAPPTRQVAQPIAETRISGIWRGGSLVANRGRCEISLEITPDQITPNRYSAALVMHCVPVVLPFWGKTGQQAMNNGANALTPANAILSGTFKDNSLVFNVDKSIAGTCPVTAATVTPFGSKELAIQWKDGCGDGDMILVR